MKLSPLVFGVLAVCAISVAAEAGPLLAVFRPLEEPTKLIVEPVRQKRSLLLGAGVLGAAALGAGAVGLGAAGLGAGLIGAKAGFIGGALAGGALSHGRSYGGWGYGGYGGGYYGGGYYGGGYGGYSIHGHGMDSGVDVQLSQFFEGHTTHLSTIIRISY